MKTLKFKGAPIWTGLQSVINIFINQGYENSRIFEYKKNLTLYVLNALALSESFMPL